MFKITGYLLVLIHLLLGAWAIGGILEMVMPQVPWKPFTNPEFPDWVLIIHWGSVLFASIVFVYGYVSHWDHTPRMMAIAYGIMAIVCIIETFWYMTSKTKFLAMGLEYVAYIVILWMLFKTQYFDDYFNE